MTREDKAVFIFGLICCLGLMCALYWIGHEAGVLRGYSDAHMAARAAIHQAVEEVKTQNAVAYSLSEDSKAKAVESARRLRELAETMQPNPFQAGR